MSARFTFAVLLALMPVITACMPEAAPAEATPAAAIGTLLAAPVPTHGLPRPLPPLATPRPPITATATLTASSSLAALLPTPTLTVIDVGLPTLTPTPAPGALPATIVDDVVNVRGGPGTNYPVVGKARKGVALTIVGRNETGSWLRVCCVEGNPPESWISADFVQVTLPPGADMTVVPVAAIPPAPEAPLAAGGGAGSAAAIVGAPAPGIPGPGNFPAPGGMNPLTGLPLPLPGGRAGQRPIIVCINNDYAARPQWGMSAADVVYEYLMEGYGITRFSAIFYGSDVAQIGPVRSARLINYTMGALYDAGLVCSGASDAVRYSLKHEAPFPYMDIDLDDPNQNRYSVSIGSDYRTRLRTGTDKLRRWLADWGVEKAPSLRGFTFGGLPGGGAPAMSISIPYPRGTGSQAAYVYDGGSGRYLRSLGGAAHVDGNTGAQIGVENVVVQVVAHEATNIVEDSLGSTSIRLNLFGSGQAIIFRDGQAFAGTWRSESRGDTPRFYDAGGAEIPLKPGKTWISIVPGNYSIAYQ
jgi:hypothetical protein